MKMRTSAETGEYSSTCVLGQKQVEKVGGEGE